VYDSDRAIREENVRLEVISTRDETVYTQNIPVSNNSNQYTRIQIPNLLPNESYYLSITTDRYSVREEASTISSKSFEFNGDEKRISNYIRNDENVGLIKTNNVGGQINLESTERSTRKINRLPYLGAVNSCNSPDGIKRISPGIT